MVTSALLSLTAMFWGIQNNGDSQRITIDHFTSAYVQGVAGEDIHPPVPSKASKKIKVAVLDTGIDENHPDLKNLISSDGFNFVDRNSNLSDQHGHGTHVSGIIALQATQQAIIMPIKVVQTGPNAPIRPQDTASGNGTALTENVAKGIKYAIENGAKVINLSLAWPASIRSESMDAAMELALKEQVIVVASAANDSTSTNLYPCIYNNVVCVGAHGPDGAFTYFSNHGSMVDLMAPGIAILSTWPTYKAPVTFAGQVGYEFRNGTSMAAPFVAGAAAELLSRGYSAKETINRLLIGTRPTREKALYQSVVVGNYSKDHKQEAKTARFGNLDIERAIQAKEASLIVPSQKERITVLWNGSDTSLPVGISWINRWKKAKTVKIRIADQEYDFKDIEEDEQFNVLWKLSLNRHSESTQFQEAEVFTTEENGMTTQRSFQITFKIQRPISTSDLPEDALLIPIEGISPHPSQTLRSVVATDQNNRLEHFIQDSDFLYLLRNGKLVGKTNIEGLEKETLLNLYRISEDRFVLISTRNSPGTRGIFVLRWFDARFYVENRIELPTETTVLNENLVWKDLGKTQVPLWISVGLTPKPDLPDFDPWNPNFRDSRLPRIYYLKEDQLRTIPLENDEIPIKVLPDHRLLTIKGSGYQAYYQLISLNLNQDPKITERMDLPLQHYRMLLGLDSGVPLLDLASGKQTGSTFSGTSSPGNLRITTLQQEPKSTQVSDTILSRESFLDSLVQTTGSFLDGSTQWHFVQTHYDLKFFNSDSNSSTSVSLNRYSYIPSMIFNRGFFPLVTSNQEYKKIPVIYIPASVANGGVSEIVWGDTKNGQIHKPAFLSLKASNGCQALGNPIPADGTTPAKLAFICKNSLILLPIQP